METTIARAIADQFRGHWNIDNKHFDIEVEENGTFAEVSGRVAVSGYIERETNGLVITSAYVVVDSLETYNEDGDETFEGLNISEIERTTESYLS